MKYQAIFITVLLVTLTNSVLQVSVEPSNSSESGLSINNCVMRNGFEEDSSNNQLYFRQIREIIPETGEHFLSTMARFYRGNTTDQMSKLSLLQNRGIAKFIGASAAGLFLLILCAITYMFKTKHTSQKTAKSTQFTFNIGKKRQSCFLLAMIIGLFISGIAVTAYSLQGLKSSTKVKEAFEQLDCSYDLFSGFYVSQNESYSFSQFSNYLQELQIAALRSRLKNNRLIWYSNHFLQNPQLLNKLIEKASKIMKQNPTILADIHNLQLMDRLNQFKVKYQNMSKAIMPNPFSQDYAGWLLHQNAFKVYRQVRPLKMSMLELQQIIQNSLSFSDQYLSPESKTQTIQWLKSIYIIFAVVAFLSIMAMYTIIRHQASFLKKVLIYSAVIACFIAFSIAVFLSIALPYIAWGCEGANHVLLSQQNWKDEIERSNVSESTRATLMMFGPYSQKNLSNLIQQQQKDYFTMLKQEIERFFPYQSSAQDLMGSLRQYYQKYQNTEQDTKNIQKVALGLMSQSFRALQQLYQRVARLAAMISHQNNKNSNVKASKAGVAFKNSVNSLCKTNFNYLYETRSRITIIAYGLLCSIIFLSEVKNIKGTFKNVKSDDLEQTHSEFNPENTEN